MAPGPAGGEAAPRRRKIKARLKSVAVVKVKTDGKKDKKDPHWKEWTRRSDKRAAEEEEIQELERRIKAEAPRAGSGAGGVENGKGGSGDGPALTTLLFSELPISKPTQDGLEKSKYERMTEIQRWAIPHALCGRDVLGEARTGSGKTLAFLVPLLECLFRQRWSRMDGLGALVVSPTRELTYQIFQVLTGVGAEHEFSAGCVVGGKDLKEEQDLVLGMNILIATPGRLLQHLDESPGFDASNLQFLVMDEADRILDFGFRDTMNHILQHLPGARQSLLFSATLHSSVHALGRAALRSPEMVSVHKDATSRTPERLKQVFMTVPVEKKVDTIFSFLRAHSFKKSIVFVSACKQVRFFYEAFKKLKPGPSIMELHGRQSLAKRMLTFKDFSDRDRAVALFCTDIAARGVDFPAVDWVVQLDCPDTVESYIHRVGRTARYESFGQSALFLAPSELAFAEKLKAARIAIRSIATKQGKVFSVASKLNALLAGDSSIKYLAQKAFISYLRSVSLMKDKETFKVDALNRDELAASLGLAVTPEVPSLEGGHRGEVDADGNSLLKRRKNQSALQRLKEKIKAKRKAAVEDDEAREEEEELRGGKKETSTKLGRWERRQKKIQAAASARKAENVASDAVADDDFLQPVHAPADAAEEPAPAPKRKVKLRLNRDGVAVGAAGKHKIFAGAVGAEASQLAALGEELRGEGFVGSDGKEVGRDSFLRRVASELAKRDSSDAALSRARIHERHKEMKRKARERREGDADDSEDNYGGGVTLGSGGDSSGSDAAPLPSPPPRKRRAAGVPVAEVKQDDRVAAPQLVAPTSGRGLRKVAGRGSANAETGGDGLNALGDLERQALSRLGGSGLFG